MRPRHQYVLLGIVGLTIAFVVAASFQTLNPGVLFGEGPTPNPLNTERYEAVLAITPADVERLPDDLVTKIVARQPPLALDMVLASPTNALVIHRDTAIALSADSKQRVLLNEIIERGIIIIGYDIDDGALGDALLRPITAEEAASEGTDLISVFFDAEQGVQVVGSYVAQSRRVGEPVGYDDISNYASALVYPVVQQVKPSPQPVWCRLITVGC